LKGRGHEAGEGKEYMKRTFNPCDECDYSFSKQNQESGMCKICGFKKLLDLEEQGKLLKLPCAVGDKVYYLTGNLNSLGKGKFDRVEESKAIGFYTDRDGLMIRLDYNWSGNHGTYGFFGKSIFLTREEAEAALKEL